MSRYLPYGRQSIGTEEARRVREVLESDWLTQGPRLREFEAALAAFCGAEHAVALAHGTEALYLACRAAGLGPGDRFITSPITFVATANAGVMCGAEPVFVDIDPRTFHLDPELTARALAADPSIKVVLPVHLAGLPADLAALGEAAAAHDAIIIDDACHAVGSLWHDADGQEHRVGDGRAAVMTCFSFHPVKCLTTGEGGAVTTNDPELAARLRMLRNHGITRDPDLMDENHGPWYYEMQELAINGRMTDIQAAIGLVQLEKLPRLRRRRADLVARYDAAFADLEGVTTQARPTRPGENDADPVCWHLMIVRTGDRDGLFQHLARRNIGPQVHYIPVHLQPYYRRTFGTGPGLCPAAEAYYAEALSLPLFPDLTDEDQDRVIEAVRGFLLEAPSSSEPEDHG